MQQNIFEPPRHILKTENGFNNIDTTRDSTLCVLILFQYLVKIRAFKNISENFW